MLGLYEFQYLVGENEIDCRFNAQKYIYCEYHLFKHIILMRFNFNKSIVALKGITYFSSTFDVVICFFRNHSYWILIPIYFHNQIMLKKD